MHDKVRVELTGRILTKVDELKELCEILMNGIPTTSRVILHIHKYMSGSGNETWKCYTDDGATVWLRQNMRERLLEWGVLEFLDDMKLESISDVSWEIETIPDGDFHRVVNIVGEPKE